MSVRRIAEMLKISPSAVSLALRGSPKVSAPVRRKVEALARRLGYRPNAKVAELMAHVRANRGGHYEGTLALTSLFDHPRPWETTEFFHRVHAGMERRATELGYRLEAFPLKGPGMTPKRLGGILEARGIEGMLCFGSQVLEDRFPAGFDRCAIVTLGLAIQTPLHRVTSHFYNDATAVLNQVWERGYRRPGLIVGQSEEVRTAYALGAYLGWYEKKLPGQTPVPVLRLDWHKREQFAAWRKRHKPDCIVVVLVSPAVPDLAGLLREHNVRVPGELGVAVVTHFLEGTGFSGLQQNHDLVGAWAVELLISRIANSDFGLPAHPRIEMVEGEWVEGGSL